MKREQKERREQRDDRKHNVTYPKRDDASVSDLKLYIFIYVFSASGGLFLQQLQ